MSDIKISSIEELDGGWLLMVLVDEYSYQVGVSRDYYQQLTAGEESVEGLVERSFEFLLEHEPASSIMRRFELSIIQEYFTDYEQTIGVASS